MWDILSYFIPPNYRLSRVRRICWRRRRIFFLAEKKNMFAKSNLHNNLDLLPDLSNKKLYFVCTTKLDPVEISPIWRAFSLCSRCNNPHVYHVNVAFTLKIYQISGLTNTFCAHNYFSDLFTKFSAWRGLNAESTRNKCFKFLPVSSCSKGLVGIRS